ncbi:hypothetical protein [Sphingomonas sp. 10B4]|uniref:hypothetical protein n=1 Tax=Sphingomonas sp. 10B4 TaxID=3048575 RepID=UPI002AB45457|nr:hypothetical protein [Sphingomonas sp. 10B4]MDY7526308.1 hypothetical protein [Sphingomonas sp. 10B4]MEB0284639.1 hypothetical protein [Sphingomonas sp. 10B4]
MLARYTTFGLVQYDQLDIAFALDEAWFKNDMNDPHRHNVAIDKPINRYAQEDEEWRFWKSCWRAAAR